MSSEFGDPIKVDWCLCTGGATTHHRCCHQSKCFPSSHGNKQLSKWRMIYLQNQGNFIIYLLKFLFIFLCITILASLHDINFVYLPKLENTITCARAARTNIRLDLTNPGLTCPMQCKDLHVNNQRTHSAFLRGLLAGVIERLHFTYSNSRGCP